MKNDPQLVEIDPNRIKFTALNPRRHQGSEFERLKQSTKEVGLVQLPTVRVLAGGFYECIDGEGRIRSAQERKDQTIWVVSYGILTDEEAATMLQAANTVRYFSFIAECKGLAAIHKQSGLPTSVLAKKFGISPETIKDYIPIGYFPEDLLQMIERGILEQSEHGTTGVTWGIRTIRSLLPLRQMLPGATDPRGSSAALEDAYEYTEVREVLRKLLKKELVTQEQLYSYVERRRRELFEERFDRALQERLQQEIEQTRIALEQTYAQRVEGAEKQTAARYEAQVNALRQQYTALDAHYQKLVREVSRRPELIEQREQELEEKLKEAAQERNRFEALQNKLQSEIEQSKAEAAKSIQSQLDTMLAQQRAMMDEQLARTKADMESYYAKRDGERQLKAETSLRQAVAHQTELLSQTQQSFFHLLSPGFVKGIAWLSDAEVAGLLAQIMAVQDTLDTARETIQDTMKQQSTVSSIEGSASRG